MLRIEDELKNNQISRFQLLYGEERYMVQYYRNQLIEKLSNPDDEMNRTFFRDKPEPSQIAEAAQILPFFAENRLIVVEDSGYFKSSSDMADYVESFPETTYIIFVEREIDKRNRLFKWINKNGWGGRVYKTAGTYVETVDCRLHEKSREKHFNKGCRAVD